MNRVTYIGREQKNSNSTDIGLVDWVSFEGAFSTRIRKNPTRTVKAAYESARDEGRLETDILLKLRPEHVVASYPIL